MTPVTIFPTLSDPIFTTEPQLHHWEQLDDETQSHTGSAAPMTSHPDTDPHASDEIPRPLDTADSDARRVFGVVWDAHFTHLEDEYSPFSLLTPRPGNGRVVTGIDSGTSEKAVTITLLTPPAPHPATLRLVDGSGAELDLEHDTETIAARLGVDPLLARLGITAAEAALRAYAAIVPAAVLARATEDTDCAGT